MQSGRLLLTAPTNVNTAAAAALRRWFQSQSTHWVSLHAHLSCIVYASRTVRKLAQLSTVVEFGLSRHGSIRLTIPKITKYQWLHVEEELVCPARNIQLRCWAIRTLCLFASSMKIILSDRQPTFKQGSVCLKLAPCPCSPGTDHRGTSSWQHDRQAAAGGTGAWH